MRLDADILCLQEICAQRERDVADVARLGSKATEAIRSANPELTALRARLMSDATAGLDAGTGLSAEETRQTQQRARAAAVPALPA